MIVEKVQKMIKEQNMIASGDLVIAGVSGGADSVCLLLALLALRETMQFSIEIIHVEHGIRGEESRQDAAFVEALAEQLQVECKRVSVNVPEYAAQKGLGLEEAARYMRYEMFEQEAKAKRAKIALAHHLEDNAETVLFQLARGSSLTGLCGMQPVRKSETGVIYIRPLLSLHRKEIEDYLEVQGQTYCIDSTNQELDYSRNYLRKVILPEMEHINLQAVAHINETANQLREVRGFLDEQIQMHWEQIARVEEDLLLDLEKLQALHVVLKKEILYKAIGMMAGGKKDISLIHVEQMLALLDKQSGKRVILPNGVVGIKENTTIRLFRENAKRSPHSENAVQDFRVSEEELKTLLEQKGTLCIPLGTTGEQMVVRVFLKDECTETDEPQSMISQTDCEGMEVADTSGGSLIQSDLRKDVVTDNRSEDGCLHCIQEIPRKTYTKWMDYDKIKDGFCIRTRRSGDYLIYDKSGHRKKLKQYFIDEKVPVTKREKTWIVAQENMVLWIIGGRISEHIKVTEETRAIVEITMKEEILE